MPQVLFDTHAAARKLEKTGHSAQQAEAVVEVMSSATEFGARMAHDLERIKLRVDNNMATKDDIAELRMATKDDIAELRMATKDVIAELRTELRTEIAKIPEMVREVLRQETPTIQLRSLVAAGSLSFSLAGLAVMVFTDESLRAIALEHGSLIGLMMILASSAVLFFLARPSRS
ncbi:MAG: hypothetical protein OXQ86_08810 [Gammaproteobacteria bacterium]|nr:hypothetical protein [Gammaproteobacteria bacterium]MDE0414040.1 hypothetical protein [Gammaproteobacteria bacterium]